MYHLVVPHRVSKQIKRLTVRDQKRINSALLEIKNDPFVSKKLEGELANMFVVRVWPFRIIYTINKKIVTVTVVSIGHRKDVYKKINK